MPTYSNGVSKEEKGSCQVGVMQGRVERLDLGNTGTTREGTNGTVASSSVKRGKP